MIKGWERGRNGISKRYEVLIKKAGLDVAPSRRAFVAAGLGLTLSGGGTGQYGEKIGMSTVSRLRERAVRLQNLDDFLGGADTYAVYAAEASGTARLLDTAAYSTVVGRELRRLLSEQLQQAGWAAFDAGAHGQARGHYLDALTAAREAEDSVLVAACLAHLGYQASVVSGEGLAEATAATEAVGSGAPGPVRALLLERQAWAHAVQGDESCVARALGDAEAALSQVGDQVPHWAGWVDRVELQIMSGRCWAELGRPVRAAPMLENALMAYPDTHARDKSLYLTWLSSAYIDGRELERAAVVATRALELATDVGSARPRQRIGQLMVRFEPYAGRSDVRVLLDQAEEWITLWFG